MGKSDNKKRRSVEPPANLKGVRPTQLTKAGFSVQNGGKESFQDRRFEDGQTFEDRIPGSFLSCHVERERAEGYIQERG